MHPFRHTSQYTLFSLIAGMFVIMCVAILGWYVWQPSGTPLPLQESHKEIDETALTAAYYDSLTKLQQTTPLTVQEVEAWLFSVRVPASLRDTHFTLAQSWARIAATHPDEAVIRDWLAGD